MSYSGIRTGDARITRSLRLLSNHCAIRASIYTVWCRCAWHVLFSWNILTFMEVTNISVLFWGAICPEFICNTAEQVSFKLYGCLTYMYIMWFSLKYLNSYGSYEHFLLVLGLGCTCSENATWTVSSKIFTLVYMITFMRGRWLLLFMAIGQSIT
jgi:hypothetical protein